MVLRLWPEDHLFKLAAARCQTKRALSPFGKSVPPGGRARKLTNVSDAPLDQQWFQEIEVCVMKNRFRKPIFVFASALMLFSLVFSSHFSGAAQRVTPADLPSAAAPTPTATPLPKTGIVEVTESGDPDDPGETLIFDELEVDDVLSESHALAAFPSEQSQYKKAQRVAEAMLEYALGLANREPPVTRQSNPAQIQRFTGLFNFRSDENPPFCAMGVAYAAAKAYCDLTPERILYTQRNHTRTLQNVLPLIKKYYFTPSPSCWFMMKEAMKRKPGQRGSWVANGTVAPKRGWLVLFDWKNKGDGRPDHVAIVKSVGRRGALHTVEFNTSITFGNQRNGGAVAQKVRKMSDVMGFIRTY